MESVDPLEVVAATEEKIIAPEQDELTGEGCCSSLAAHMLPLQSMQSS